jgi:hypothetical protein
MKLETAKKNPNFEKREKKMKQYFVVIGSHTIREPAPS